MSRKDALLRLHQGLVAKRDELRRQIADELNATQGATSIGGDEVDAAMNGSQSELHSQLAALESRELLQIERAIVQIRDGQYGLCEHCHTKIPVARLKALPFTTFCIQCQQQQEIHGRFNEDEASDWETLYEFEGSRTESELRIGDFDLDVN